MSVFNLNPIKKSVILSILFICALAGISNAGEFLSPKRISTTKFGSAEGEFDIQAKAVAPLGSDFSKYLCIDYKQNLYLIDPYGIKINKYDNSGKYLFSILYNSLQPDEARYIAMASDENNELYIKISWIDYSFLLVDENMKLTKKISKAFKYDSKDTLALTYGISGFSVDKHGYLYVNKREKERGRFLDIYDKNGNKANSIDKLPTELLYVDLYGILYKYDGQDSNLNMNYYVVTDRFGNLLDKEWMGIMSDQSDLERNVYFDEPRDGVVPNFATGMFQFDKYNNLLSKIEKPESKYEPTVTKIFEYDGVEYGADIPGDVIVEYSGMRVDPYGNIYQLGYTQKELFVNKYQRINYNPTKLTVGLPLSKYPNSQLYVDPDGKLYAFVINKDSDAISKFNSQGKKLFTFGSKGKGPGQFEEIKQIAVDKDGNILVEDTYLSKSNKAGNAQIYQKLLVAMDKQFFGDDTLKAYKKPIEIRTREETIKTLKPSGDIMIFTSREFLLGKMTDFYYVVDLKRRRMTRYNKKGYQFGVFILKDIKEHARQGEEVEEKQVIRVQKFSPSGKYLGKIDGTIQNAAYGYSANSFYMERENIEEKNGLKRLAMVKDIPTIRLRDKAGNLVRDFKYGWGDTLEAVSVVGVRGAGEKEKTEIAEELGDKRIYILVKWQERWGDKYTPKEEVVIFDEKGNFVNRVYLWKEEGLPSVATSAARAKGGDIAVRGNGTVYQVTKGEVVKWVRE